MKALEEIRWLLKGSPFLIKLYTDYKALLKTLKLEDTIGRIARWQLALSEYNLDIYHVPGKDIVIADGLSRMTGYPAMDPTDEETELVVFMIIEEEEDIGHNTTAGDPAIVSEKDGMDKGPLGKPAETEPSEAWLYDWEEWLSDLWYGGIIEFKMMTAEGLKAKIEERSLLLRAIKEVIEVKAKKFVLVEHETGNLLAYRERNGKLSRCIYEPQVPIVLKILHDAHGYFSDGPTFRRTVGKFY